MEPLPVDCLTGFSLGPEDLSHRPGTPYSRKLWNHAMSTCQGFEDIIDCKIREAQIILHILPADPSDEDGNSMED